MATIQKIHIKTTSPFQRAKSYYQILFSLNNIHLTPMEINLIAFMATKGTISSPPIREEFITTFKASLGSINNMSSRLQKLKLFSKEKGKVRVSSKYIIDFSQSILLQMFIENEVNNSTAALKEN